MSRRLREIAEAVQAEIVGNPDVEITGVAAISSAAPGDLVFVEEAKHLPAAIACPAAAIVAAKFAETLASGKPVLISVQPKLAFSRAAVLLRSKSGLKPGVHPSAVVHPSARVHQGAAVEERVVLREHVEIASGTRIGAGSVIGANTVIGSDCEIYPNVTVYPGTRIGNHVIVHAGAILGSDGFGYVRDAATGSYEKFPQIGRLEIEDNVEIGANTTIDRGALEVTRIGRGTKIDNLVHIGHNVQIGENVVIAAQTGLSGSITIEKNVILGGQVGIGEHARIEEGVMLGGQSGVLPKKILRGNGIAFWGTPAKPLREYLKELAVLARIAKKE